MTWHRRLLAVRRIAIKIMPLSMAHKLASRIFEFANEGLPLHTSNSTGSFWAMPGAGDRS